GVIVEVPEGEKIAKKTKNEKLGIMGGISILGTTGFVEPWCKRLVETKIEVARQYGKIAICTGRKSWLYAFEKYKDYQPFVFGVHIDEILVSHPGEKILIGSKGLLARWAGGIDKIKIKAKRYNVKKVEIID
ncbi:MAG TPA: cobalt-precorrin-5B (C(1))-methyltransferase, partial [Archaeoglobus profundus]|nr:cobalt-precorrin-5B (C(1))-methyltransferase [Archaeoglobus profundus]